MLATLVASLLIAPAGVAQFPVPRLPGEFEPQRAVWLSWPRFDHVEGVPVAPVVAKIAAEVSRGQAVEILVTDGEMEKVARSVIAAAKGDLGKVTFHPMLNNEIWIRDFGPIFIYAADGKKQVVTFRFNYWGYGEKEDAISQAEDVVDEFVAGILGLPTQTSSVISEGGNRESNGRGTLIAVAAVERQRNPNLSLVDVSREFSRVFGTKKLIWLPEGMADDDHTFRGPLPGGKYTCVTTGGHVDNVARLTGPRTILLAEVSEAEARRDPIAAISRERLLQAESILRRSTDQDGQPFRIVRMPTPDPVVKEVKPGDWVYDSIADLKYAKPFPKGKPVRVIAAGSYMNFLITNDSVITSSFWKPGRPESTRRKDAKSLAILKQLFPGRRVVAVDAEAVNWGGGGIHCITQQEPK